MVNKKILLGMLVMVLVFGMTVVGCNFDDGIALEFQIAHGGNINRVGRTITQVEFINGGSSNASVLQTEILNLKYGEISSKYKISGFTEKYGDNKDEYIFGVRLTLDNGDTIFDNAHGKNNDFFLVRLTDFSFLLFNPSW